MYLLTRRRSISVPSDPDAAIYIANVEAADGQALENSVRSAYNQFFRGCRSDPSPIPGASNLDAIKACCILAGARTLAGALVPLKGAAPTNFNFVSADYNRKTGLVGNGSTKYLNSNRNANADPQGNRHIGVWISTASSGSSRSYLGCRNPANSLFIGGLAFAEPTIDSRTLFAGSRSATGLMAVQATSSNLLQARVGGVTFNQGVTSVSAGPAIPYFALAENSSGNPDRFSNGRLSFYSIGEAVDLALLDARVTALMNALAVAIP